ncbi:hypothetical protein CPB83DRAFT_863746 [Crepidotus variabilis]|uniref:Uncharacterized protein n=1 Tax=Crepidotus variabilis TaxID=179855 RepID=A0A9P6E5I8_9AGAR|nr:hypothetical protein CPB83DRAFT_863746 [Crepidotus variabilis]
MFIQIFWCQDRFQRLKTSARSGHVMGNTGDPGDNQTPVILSSIKTIAAEIGMVGGLWSFFNGLFVVVFGTSIMRIFFGLKLLSVFGLAHESQKSKLRDACHEEYLAFNRISQPCLQIEASSL